MSLRGRVAITAAGAVAIAVLVVALLTYAATERRLERAVDDDLDQTAEQILALDVPGGNPTIARRLAAFSELQRRAQQGDGARPGPRGTRRDRFLGPLDVGVVQVVTVARTVATSGAVTLPTATADRAFEAGANVPVRATVDVDGRSLRVLALAVGDGAGDALAVLQLGAPIDDIVGSLAALRRQLLLAGLLGVALAAALGAGVADRAVRPVRRLTEAAEAVGRTGDLATRIDGEGTDELGRLARSFNAMLASLEQARASQQQLVADASHELRTPLTSLRTNIEVLQLGGSLPADEQAALLGDVTAQIEEFGRLVDGMVELARGDTPQRAPTRVPLSDVVRDVVDRMAVYAPEVRIEVIADESQVLAERDRLERAVSNLVENAVKHGGGTPVAVTISNGVIRVRDHGPGIAEADLPHVFDRFYRAPDARSRPGSGLGLSIVAQVADALGGSYAARSHPDGGAEVELRIPVS